MLTARGNGSDRVVGLELGADDYVVKPFAAGEVISRIRAVLRRARPCVPAHMLAVGDLRSISGPPGVARRAELD